MFNVSKFLRTPEKIILENNFKSYLYDSVNKYNKYNKLTNEINEKNKKKAEIQNILYGNTLIKTSNHSQHELINNAKYNNFIFIFSFVSIGALLFYKSK
jgi:hypothetical protein